MSIVRALGIVASLLVAAMVVGCGGEEATPTVTPAAVEEGVAAPTSTPAPTQTPTPAKVLFPFTVVDGNGEEFVFDAPPERILAYDSAVVEILFAIGEGHRIAGTHDFVEFPPEAADIPRFGSAFDMNIEAIVELAPDLVYIFSPGFLEDLRNANLNVLYIETLTDDLEKTADVIRLWGDIVGSPEPAETLAADFKARVDAIKTALAGVDQGPSVFRDEGGLWSSGPDTLMGEVFDLLKLQNIAHDVTGFAQVSPEIIVERDPEFLVISSFSDMTENPAFKDISAIANDRIIRLEGEPLSVAGPRFIEGIETLAKAIYPDLFE